MDSSTSGLQYKWTPVQVDACTAYLMALTRSQRCVLDMVAVVTLASLRLLAFQSWLPAQYYDRARFDHHPSVFIAVVFLSLVVRIMELRESHRQVNQLRSPCTVSRWRVGIAHCFIPAGFSIAWYDAFHDTKGAMMVARTTTSAARIHPLYGTRTILSSVMLYFATNMIRSD